MEEKLRRLMKHEGINSTRLAEILGIQASGISHIMSGRNKPSYDFLLKLLQRFPQINPDWLMLDKGPMYRDEIKNKGGQSAPAVGGGAGVAERTGAAGRGGDVSGAGSTVARGLFEPDNNDIIPSGGHRTGSEAYSTATGQQHPAAIGQHPATTPGQQHLPNVAPVGQDSTPASDRHSPQHPAYRAGGFTRSASIERIVVFYKDKTFSEYQPE